MKVDEDQNQALFCTFNMMSTEAVVKLIVTPGMMHSSQAKVAFYDVRQQVQTVNDGRKTPSSGGFCMFQPTDYKLALHFPVV